MYLVRISNLVDVSHFIGGPSEEILIIWTDTRLDEKGTTFMAFVTVHWKIRCLHPLLHNQCYFLYSEAEMAIINWCSKFMVTWRDCWAECAHEQRGVFDSAFYNELALCHIHRIYRNVPLWLWDKAAMSYWKRQDSY